MKTKILSLLAIAGLLFFAGCASDDTTNKEEQQEPGTEGLTSFVEDDNTTRTTGEYDGSGFNFFWTAGDRLWVNNTAASPALKQDSRNNINSKLTTSSVTGGVNRADKARFWFDGTYTNNSYPVRYTGNGNTHGDKVTIKAQQTQTVPNDASHIGEDGDCGIATATKPAGENRYYFTLNHEASYLTFLPYNAQGKLTGMLQKIKVSADQAICGTFDFNDSGIDQSSRPAASSTTQSIELTLSSFPIPTTATASTNAATMVIAPGTYTNFTVEYTLQDPVTWPTVTITKTYPNVTFTAGRNKRVSQDLQITVYPGNEYYMWDAQQHYWAGYEWDGTNPTQPTTDYASNSTDAPQSTASTSAHTPRDFNDIQGYSDATGAAPAVLPTTSHFQALPNVNELLWYAQNGEPHWDNTTLWATMGHLYKGGMWFKKKGNISGYSATQAPDGIDYTKSTSTASYSGFTIPTGKPTNLNDYFYLPALGYYYSGTLDAVGGSGIYWSSTPTPWDTDNAYRLNIGSGVFVTSGNRYFGFRLWSGQ